LRLAFNKWRNTLNPLPAHHDLEFRSLYLSNTALLAKLLTDLKLKRLSLAFTTLTLHDYPLEEKHHLTTTAHRLLTQVQTHLLKKPTIDSALQDTLTKVKSLFQSHLLQSLQPQRKCLVEFRGQEKVVAMQRLIRKREERGLIDRRIAKAFKLWQSVLLD
jgi:hypothetical protein